MKRSTPASAAQAAIPQTTGLVVASFGRQLLVETAAGTRVRCVPRGKRLEAVVGDRVEWMPSGDGGVIERVLPRRNLLFRQDMQRTKTLAANIDQVLVMVAAQPRPSPMQLARALIAAHAAGVQALIAVNKRDLQADFEEAWAQLAPYRAMNETVLALQLTAPDDPALPALQALLQGRVTLVMGGSGVGKSTLVNRLVPQARAETQAISQALGTGRHTTTRTTWYWLDETRTGALIDSPGFHEFGLHHIEPMQLAGLMPDFAPFLGQCRFHNCTHRQEPGCAVAAAVAPAGPIHPQRWQLYRQLFEELVDVRRH
jgi:ribosome biogenesis GTPase